MVKKLISTNTNPEPVIKMTSIETSEIPIEKAENSIEIKNIDGQKYLSTIKDNSIDLILNYYNFIFIVFPNNLPKIPHLFFSPNYSIFPSKSKQQYVSIRPLKLPVSKFLPILYYKV